MLCPQGGGGAVAVSAIRCKLGVKVSARLGRGWLGKGSPLGSPPTKGREEMRTSTKLIRLCSVVPASLAGSFLAVMGLGFLDRKSVV